MGFLEGAAMDIAIIAAGGAVGGAGAALLVGYVPSLPANLIIPAGVGLGAGAANSMYDLIDSDRSVQLTVESKTAIVAGALGFFLLNMGGNLPLIGPMISSSVAGSAYVGALSGAVAGWYMPSS